MFELYRNEQVIYELQDKFLHMNQQITKTFEK